jgi:predicted component of type VI protein secretion system
MCKSEIAKSGPAKNWCVTAWLKEFKNKKEESKTVIGWRVSSPGRSRTFDTFSSSRGTPNLKDAVSDAVYTQITTGMKPGLAQKIREKRLSLESKRPASSSSSGVTPPRKKANQDKENKTTPPAKRETANVKNNVKRELATPARVTRSQAKRARVDEGGAAAAAPCKVWACGCVAHLRRQPKCTPPGELQPPLVHLQDYMNIGRADTCDLSIDAKQAPQMISRSHALLQREENTFILTDKGSVNGMTVNGQRVVGKRVLVHGDEITFGVVTARPELDYIFEMNPDRR